MGTKSYGQGGLSQCGQGERGQFFAILCGRPYGRPLIKTFL